MNKLLTFTGAQPIYLGDIDFTQSANAQMVTCLARALMGEGSNTLKGILQGVILTRTAETTSWTAGVIVWDGEILPVESGSLSVAQSETLYFQKVSVLSGSRIFKNGESHSCWETRSATITTATTGAVSMSQFPRLQNGQAQQIYTGSSIDSNYITGGALALKNGLFFIRVDLDATSGISAGDIGSFVLLGMRADDVLSLAGRSFYTSLYVEFSNSVFVKNVRLSFSRYSSNALQVDAELLDSSFVAGGPGIIQAMIPVI